MDETFEVGGSASASVSLEAGLSADAGISLNVSQQPVAIPAVSATGSKTPYPYNLPVSFHFNVNIPGKSSGDDIKFQEVSGLTAEIGIEELNVGGENMFSYKLPTRARYRNLVLKRGMLQDTQLVEWFRKAIEGFEFEPVDVSIHLLNENNDVITSWDVIQAYPVKWVISDFNAKGNTLVIETIELAYQYFQRKKA
ncbi:MAG: phage tail protein [Chitinophagaceae bacterium]